MPDIEILREYEFFGGCIRVKISVRNTSDLAILDAALELESDERILHFDRCEPEYPEKKGKILHAVFLWGLRIKTWRLRMV